MKQGGYLQPCFSLSLFSWSQGGWITLHQIDLRWSRNQAITISAHLRFWNSREGEKRVRNRKKEEDGTRFFIFCWTIYAAIIINIFSLHSFLCLLTVVQFQPLKEKCFEEETQEGQDDFLPLLDRESNSTSSSSSQLILEPTANSFPDWAAPFRLHSNSNKKGINIFTLRFSIRFIRCEWLKRMNGENVREVIHLLNGSFVVWSTKRGTEWVWNWKGEAWTEGL